MDKTKIGELLTKLREERNKSRQEVAEAIGVSLSAITMYELGQRIPRDEVKKKIAEYYSKSVQSIFFNE